MDDLTSYDDAQVVLLYPPTDDERDRGQTLQDLGFQDISMAQQRLAGICETNEQRKTLKACISNFLWSMSESANPDQSLLNFERYVQCCGDRSELFQFLAENPRSVEILVRLF